MAWFKIDDGWWSHPKTLQLSDAAIALWARAGSWSCQQLTDGQISVEALSMLRGRPKTADELVAVGYWDLHDGGWAFHDWDEYQEHSDVVKKRRSDARERMRTVRANKTRTKGERSQEVLSTPTRPDPTPLSTDVDKRERAAKRGSRLSPDWQPTAESIAKAREDAPHVDHRSEHIVFVDYWIAQPGQKGVKTDWDATWRNWMRRKEGDMSSRGTRKPTRTEENLAVIAQYADQQYQQGEIAL